LVASKEVGKNLVNIDSLCNCIDWALAKQNYVVVSGKLDLSKLNFLRSPYTEMGIRTTTPIVAAAAALGRR
jgi:hypothetical protein